VKPLLAVAAGMIIAVQSAIAADSTFSKDSTHVYAARVGLVDIDLAKQTCRNILLSSTEIGEIQGVTLSNSGAVLFTTTNAVWSYDPATSKTVKLCNAPDNISLNDLAYNPATDQILVTGAAAPDPYSSEQPVILCLQKDGKQFANVRARYGARVDSPVFTADGTLFFTCVGDLWMGYIQAGDSDSNTRDLDLTAYRCAPLASLIDENTSPPSTGLHDIALSQHSVYAKYYRMGGSGWGSTLRFKRPAPLSGDDGDDDRLPSVGSTDWKALQRIIDSVQVLDDNPCSILCASRDGSLVFYYNSHPMPGDIHLIHHDGKPAILHIKGLDDW